MKVCRKCKSKNDLQARFCFQCGTRLSTTLAHSRLVMPDSHKVAIQTPLDLNEFIKHPLQKSADVITSQNQGKQLNPELQEKIHKIAPRGLNKSDEAKTKRVILDSNKVPFPRQLKRSEPSNEISTTTKMRINKRTSPENLIKEDTIINSRVDRQTAPEGSSTTSCGLLNPEQKLRLRGGLRGGLISNDKTDSAVNGLRPANKEFSLARLEQMENQKREKLEKENRRKQLRHDLAYLDQVFPNETSELQPRTELPTKLESFKEDSDSRTNTIISEPAAALDTMTSDLRVPTEIGEVENDCGPTKSSKYRSNQWINTIGKEGPARPADRLNQSARLDSGEFITPFLTIAAFVYFCYVLYI